MSVKERNVSHWIGITGFVEDHIGVHSFRVNRMASKFGKGYLTCLD